MGGEPIGLLQSRGYHIHLSYLGVRRTPDDPGIMGFQSRTGEHNVLRMYGTLYGAS